MAYETLKREAYARHPADIAAYNDDKDAWIKQIESGGNNVVSSTRALTEGLLYLYV